MSWYYLIGISLFVTGVTHLFRRLEWFEALALVASLTLALRFALPWGAIHELGWWALLLLLWPMLIATVSLLREPY